MFKNFIKQFLDLSKEFCETTADLYRVSVAGFTAFEFKVFYGLFQPIDEPMFSKHVLDDLRIWFKENKIRYYFDMVGTIVTSVYVWKEEDANLFRLSWNDKLSIYTPKELKEAIKNAKN